jgi:hypothetical protein
MPKVVDLEAVMTGVVQSELRRVIVTTPMPSSPISMEVSPNSRNNVVVVRPDTTEELVLLAVAESMEILTGALKDTPLRVPAKVPVKEYCIFTVAAEAPPVSDPMAIKVAASVLAETAVVRRFFF